MILAKLFATLVLSVISIQSCQSSAGGRDALIDRWETENKGFRIRISEYREARPAFLTHFYYVFESMPAGGSEWREVMAFKHDDDVSMHDQVRFVDEGIAYGFMGWMYAVTTDGGKNWFIWSAERGLPNWECCNYRLIADVSMAKDGTGLMKLNAIQGRRGEVPELRTNDYGRHWRAE